jgi:hypothetical protein
LEAGIVCTIWDIAAAEKLSDRFVSHATRLAYLARVSLRGWSRNASRRR